MMIRQDQSELLQSILRCLLPLLDKRVLLLFCGGSADAPALLASVDKLLASQARLVLSPAFQALAPADFLQSIRERRLNEEAEVRSFIEQAQLLVAPVLTRNSLVKASLGIADSLVSNALAAGLMRGLPLIGVRDNYHPQSALARERGYAANPAYNELILEHERRLSRLGAKLVPAAEFEPTLKREIYPFLTEERSRPPGPVARPGLGEAGGIGGTGGPGEMALRIDGPSVLTWADLAGLAAGSSLEIGPRVAVTPLALELMNSRNIRLIRSNGNKEGKL